MSEATDKLGSNLAQIVTMKEKGKEFTPKWIKDASVIFAAEWAESGIHSHSIIRISHYTRIQLDFEKIAQFIKAELGINEKIYVNALLIPKGPAMTDEGLEAYLKKSFISTAPL